MRKKFVLCLDNTNYKASLIQRKLYEILPDEKAKQDGLIRVIDESGEDYLYDAKRFIYIELPIQVKRVLATG